MWAVVTATETTAQPPVGAGKPAPTDSVVNLQTAIGAVIGAWC
jgi:hypothetical protein